MALLLEKVTRRGWYPLQLTSKITISGILLALGILLPSVFHTFGMGIIFLPMHIPVLLGGFIVGPVYGACIGLFIPLLSTLLTGMPPTMPPIAQMMMVELTVYGLLTGFFYQNLRQGVFVSLIMAMLGGRIVYGILGALALPLFGLPKIDFLYPITTGLVTSIPGILIQLILIPVLVLAIEKRNHQF
mgnify:CR=1 FL=1